MIDNMTDKEIINLKDKIFYFLSKNQLGRAIDLIEKLLTHIQDGFYSDEVLALKTNYKLMLHYAFHGINDPEQPIVMQRLIKESYEITEHISQKILQANSALYYYRNQRLFAVQPAIADSVLMDSFLSFQQVPEDKVSVEQLREYEYNLQYLFNKYFFADVYDDTMLYFVEEMNKKTTEVELCSLVSAITLSGISFFDENKYNSLIILASSQYKEVVMRAITGLVLFMYFHNHRIALYPVIRNNITVFFDSDENKEKAQMIVKQLIRSKETDKITKDITENILPELSKIAPQIREDLADMDKNEDFEDKKTNWQDLLDESGISDKMQQYAELQSQGSDIQMSTFSMLKNYPFFLQVSNWFLPFYAKHSSVINLFKGQKDASFLKLLVNSPILCHSDKYSFCLNLAVVPDHYRSIMMNGVEMESEQIKEINSDQEKISSSLIEQSILSKYIQDMYRFYKIFPKSNKNSFDDIFTFKFDFHKSWFFKYLNPNEGFLSELADFYFAKELYDNALSAFLDIEKEAIVDAELCRKIGFCFQKTYNYSKAIEYYQKAEIIETDNLWTIRKIAYCYRNLKMTEQALAYYKHANNLDINNLNLIFTIGVCYVELEQYDKALHYFYKIEFINNNHKKSENYIALCSFLQKNYTLAIKYYTKQPEKNTSYEWLYLGHSYWCDNNKKKALECYKLSAKLIKKETKQAKEFYESLEQDSAVLQQHGILSNDLTFIADAVRLDV